MRATPGNRPRALALGCLVLGAFAGTAWTARADVTADEATGGAALRQARAAWDTGALETAEPLYREALEKGGLGPPDVLEGYVRLGSIRAALGKKDQALAAFRAASILDATFAVPTEAGPKGPTLAVQAKSETAAIGSILLKLAAPKETPSGRSFKVSARLDAAHVAIVAKVALVARDGTSGKEVVAEGRPAESVELEVASYVTLPDANVLVRVDALDRQGNRLASAEKRVHVVDTGAEARAGAPEGVSASNTPAQTSQREGGGFWKSPWPYLVGSLALAGAGAALYLGTRPSDQVALGQVGVRAK